MCGGEAAVLENWSHPVVSTSGDVCPHSLNMLLQGLFLPSFLPIHIHPVSTYLVLGFAPTYYLYFRAHFWVCSCSFGGLYVYRPNAKFFQASDVTLQSAKSFTSSDCSYLFTSRFDWYVVVCWHSSSVHSHSPVCSCIVVRCVHVHSISGQAGLQVGRTIMFYIIGGVHDKLWASFFPASASMWLAFQRQHTTTAHF